MNYGYLFYIILGFFSGSILYGKIIPLLLKKVDVTKQSTDGNPGAFNAFACGGPICGTIALLLDLLKGALPVIGCATHLGTDHFLFALVLAAPVFGHAHSIFNKGDGGKGIAVSFGVLLGLLPIWRPLVLLIVAYLLFLVIIPSKSNTRKSIFAFFAFGIGSIFIVRDRMIVLGCIFIASIVIHKHYLSAISCEQLPDDSIEKPVEKTIEDTANERRIP